MSRHINDLILSRRAVLGGISTLPLLYVAGCATARAPAGLGFAPVARTTADTVTVPQGYRVQTLVSWGDALFDGMAPFDPDTLTRAEQELRFGQNNDMLALFPARYGFPWATDQDDLILCANNEFFDPALTFPSLRSPAEFTPAHGAALFASMGVSVVRVRQTGGRWRIVRDPAPGHGLNRRITPFTPVVFSGPAASHRWIAAASGAFNAAEPGLAHEAAHPNSVRCGTLGNCAGGRTPWGTYLTAEENFNYYFSMSNPDAPGVVATAGDAAWIWDAARFSHPRARGGSPLVPAHFDVSGNPYGPSLYGWVVEIDPHDPSWAPRKRTALGRKKSECANTAIAHDGQVAVYMGDDQIDQFVFKFVTEGRFDPNNRLANRDLLDAGTLYAAQFHEDGTGEWIELGLDACNAAAAATPGHAAFTDRGDVAIRAREAAVLLGATPMDRPEDVEAPVDENWRGLGFLLIVCTNNYVQSLQHPGNPRRGEAQTSAIPQRNVAGHIIRIDEDNGDHAATRFTWDVFALGGDPDATTAETSATLNGTPTISGDRFASPDNICFDRRGNLWIATDGSPAVFGDCNDSVLVTPIDTPAPRPMKRFLTGPVGAEICGPTLAPDERAFLCAIQHPGEADTSNVAIGELRWQRGQRPPSSFPDGGDAWPRSSVVVVTREDGGIVGE